MHVHGLDPASTYFWIDIFAVNQHPGREQEADLSQLAEAISLSTNTLLCMDETGLYSLFSIQVFCEIFFGSPLVNIHKY